RSPGSSCDCPSRTCRDNADLPSPSRARRSRSPCRRWAEACRFRSSSFHSTTRTTQRSREQRRLANGFRLLLSTLARLQLRRFRDGHADEARALHEVLHAEANELGVRFADVGIALLGRLHLAPVREELAPVRLEDRLHLLLRVARVPEHVVVRDARDVSPG